MMRIRTSNAWLAVAAVLIVVPAVAADPSEFRWSRPFPLVGIPKTAAAAHRAAADKLAKAFGCPLIASDSNPVCCVWLDLALPRPNPGVDGYIILHQEGGSLPGEARD